MSITKTVADLAKERHKTVEELLKELNASGISCQSEDDVINSSDLLKFLQQKKSGGTLGKKKLTLGSSKSAGSTASGKIRLKKRMTAQSEKTFEESILVTKETNEEKEQAAQRQAKAVKQEELKEDKPEKPAVNHEPEAEKKDKPKKTTSEHKAKPSQAAQAPASTDARKGKDKRKKTENKEGRPSAKARQDKRSQKHRGYLDLTGDGYEAPMRRHRKKRPHTQDTTAIQHDFTKPTAPVIKEVAIAETISVAELAHRMSIPASQVIKKMMLDWGAMVTINQLIDQETAVLIVEDMGHTAKIVSSDHMEEELAALKETQNKGDILPRSPVVTIMGHVDHGKTSLLDYIRTSKVAAKEAGGITQHIGAYHVEMKKGGITFLDTPGHEAFTAMRARGAECTDIVVLIVAADDGVMPQTQEAIQHAKAANVPIVVAVNKIDKPESDPDRIMNELTQYEVVPEDWGGDVMFQKISAKTGEGVDALLDSIILQSEVLELKSVASGPASGLVVESSLDKGRGSLATILVQEGELKVGDYVLVGREHGRVRAMVGDDGSSRQSAGPSIPVEILGLSSTPQAGDDVTVMPSEKKAREVALFRQGKFRDIRLAKKQTASLEHLFSRIKEQEQVYLNVVLKADMQGSVEAIQESLNKLSTDDVKVNIVASGAGAISESDINLAIASHAIVVGFNVRANLNTRKLAEAEEVDLRYYSIIYQLIDDVKAAMTGLLAPIEEEKIIATAEVREVFRVKKLGAVAGCMITDGTIKRKNRIRVLREGLVIFEGELESLKRFKDDASEARQGMECGIGVKNYNDIKTGDIIEAYEIIQVSREL